MDHNVFSTVCQKCGRTIYEGEMLNVKGKYVCEGCASLYIFERVDSPAKRRKVPNAFFHFIFSIHPGAGHMYLGLMKKGLFQMCLFYFCIYLTTIALRLFWFFIPITWMYSFFDSITLRRSLVNGEIISDDIYSDKSFFNRNMGLIAFFVVIMLLISGVSALFGVMVRKPNPPRIDTSIRNSVESFSSEREYNPGSVTEVYVSRQGRNIADIAKPVLLTGLGGLIVFNVMKNRRS